jgi:lipopolysaccharide export LptBFGC system permease protein LptF
MRRGLRVGGRLDRYVASLFVSSYATAFFVLVGLFLILDMAANLDEYLETWPSGGSAPLLLIARYYLLNIPFQFLQVAPFITLVAGLFTASKLLKHSEVTAALAAGISVQRLLAPVFVGAIVCGILMLELRETLSSTLARQRDAAKYVLTHQQYDEVYSELWLRDLNGSVVHLKEFRPAGTQSRAPEARGLEATLRSAAQWSSTSASRATFEDRGGVVAWWLDDGLRREVLGIDVQRPVDRLEGFDFSPQLALSYHRARENPLDLSFGEARELARRDPDNVVYRTLLQYHLTFPLANLVLLLVGLPIMMRSSRGKGVEGVAAGCLLCIFYFAADFVLRNLGLQGAIDPYLAAWLPVLAFGSLGLALFESMDT